MTQQELAQTIRVTRQTVNAIEQGKYSPSLEAAFQNAEVFGEPLESVFYYSSEEQWLGIGQNISDVRERCERDVQNSCG